MYRHRFLIADVAIVTNGLPEPNCLKATAATWRMAEPAAMCAALPF